MAGVRGNLVKISGALPTDWCGSSWLHLALSSVSITQIREGLQRDAVAGLKCDVWLRSVHLVLRQREGRASGRRATREVENQNRVWWIGEKKK